MTKTKKILIPIIAILVLASVVGIGFAAWLIVNPIDQNVEGGSFVSNEVKDYTFTATAAASGSITFGRPTAETTTGTWLSAEADDPADNLSATITVTLDPTNDGVTAEQMLNGKKLKVTISYLGVKNGENYENANAFATAITGTTVGDTAKSYLANPTLKVGEASAVGPTSGNWGADNLYVELDASKFTAQADKTYTAQITITFAWGTLTGGANPYTYYNAQTYSKDLADQASAMLTAVRALNEGKYNIHLQTV